MALRAITRDIFGRRARAIHHIVRLCSIPPVRWSDEFLAQVHAAVPEDARYQEGLKALTTEEGRKNSPVPSKEAGLLYHKLRLYVPKALEETIVNTEHDSPVASHFGQGKTVELIKTNF